jgi:hypothetical protein
MLLRLALVPAVTSALVLGMGCGPLSPRSGPLPDSTAASRPSASPTSGPPQPTAGLPVSAHPFAVMIDNLPESRPQSGLDRADVIYEAPAEGGIPRLLAVFLKNAEAERIGPVRSTRHYFVQLAAEYGLPLVHIGSSPQGLVAMEQLRLERLDEARGDSGFLRDPNRRPPHDAFVTSRSVRAELDRRQVALRPTSAGLAYGAFKAGVEPANRVRLAYPGHAGYVAQYEYDATSRLYQRSLDGQPHVDGASGRRYTARAVIVQMVQVQPIPNDEAGRVEVELIGTGRGLLLAEGTRVGLHWSKPSPAEPTRYLRDDGAPFALPDGQLWVQLFPLDAQAELS